ncbi:hypothetical protein ILYODFUR_017668 [Ilyodon furcidens]|uniref:Uncharacterized protein n=1 Tax=Ilyodon furcidens TaxID=33524 RepID=A0ABV0T8X2_9TELE
MLMLELVKEPETFRGSLSLKDQETLTALIHLAAFSQSAAAVRGVPLWSNPTSFWPGLGTDYCRSNGCSGDLRDSLLHGAFRVLTKNSEIRNVCRLKPDLWRIHVHLVT